MIAPNRLPSRSGPVDSGDVLGRVSKKTFGDTDWVSLAMKSCAAHLMPAIRSGKPYRIANAVRAIAHVPTAEQVDDVVNAACDAMLSEAYAGRDARSISNATVARSVSASVVAELRQSSGFGTPSRLRETVDAYLKIVTFVNPRVGERLNAVGSMAARIAAAMQLSPASVLEVELAGRLHDIGSLSLRGTKLGAGSFPDHVALGEAFLESEPQLAHLAPIVHSHHERYDGLGHPDRLKADEIPLASRIIGVAAAFVDLISPMAPTVDAMPPNDACRELILRAGADLDPDVVTATLHLLHYRQRSTNRSA